MMAVDQSLAPWVSSPKVLEVVESLFGANAKITFGTGQTNHPGCERQEWHSDWPFNQTGSAHIPAPYADAACHLTALFMLDEMNEQNGTVLLAGSHRAPTNPSVPGVQPPMWPHPRERRATGGAGSVLIIDSRLWHAIPPNPTDASRVAFAVRDAPLVEVGERARELAQQGARGRLGEARRLEDELEELAALDAFHDESQRRRGFERALVADDARVPEPAQDHRLPQQPLGREVGPQPERPRVDRLNGVDRAGRPLDARAHDRERALADRVAELEPRVERVARPEREAAGRRRGAEPDADVLGAVVPSRRQLVPRRRLAAPRARGGARPLQPIRPPVVARDLHPTPGAARRESTPSRMPARRALPKLKSDFQVSGPT